MGLDAKLYEKGNYILRVNFFITQAIHLHYNSGQVYSTATNLIADFQKKNSLLH